MLMFAGAMFGFPSESYGSFEIHGAVCWRGDKKVTPKEVEALRKRFAEGVNKVDEPIIKAELAATKIEEKRDVKGSEKSGSVVRKALDQKHERTRVKPDPLRNTMRPAMVELKKEDEIPLENVPATYSKEVIKGNLDAKGKYLYSGLGENGGKFLVFQDKGDLTRYNALKAGDPVFCKQGENIIEAFLRHMDEKDEKIDGCDNFFAEALNIFRKSKSDAAREGHEGSGSVIFNKFFGELSKIKNCPHFRIVLLKKRERDDSNCSLPVLTGDNEPVSSYFHYLRIKVFSEKGQENEPLDAENDTTFFIQYWENKEKGILVFHKIDEEHSSEMIEASKDEEPSREESESSEDKVFVCPR